MEKEKIKKIIRKAKLNVRNFRLKLTNFGLAYSYDNIIEINRIYLKYPKLFEEILKHELEHLKDTSFLNSIKLDVVEGVKDIFNRRKFKENIKFALKHPKANFQSIFPIWYTKGQLSYSSLTSILYGLMTFIVIFMIYF